MHVEAAGGLVLLACAATALVIANTTAGDAWLGFWSTQVGLSFGEFEMVTERLDLTPSPSAQLLAFSDDGF